MPTRMRLRHRKEARRDKALAMREISARITPTEQLKRLNARLGVNVGAIKERKRLLNKLQ